MNYQVEYYCFILLSLKFLIVVFEKDPVPALEYAQSLQKRAEKVSDLEVENQKLRETLGKEINH